MKRKRVFEVPSKVQSFISSVTDVPFEDIETPLKGFIWEFEKGDFYHWGKLFNHFGSFFETYIKPRKDLRLEDDFLATEFPFPKAAVLEILRVVRVILENCSNKHLYSSYEQHLSTLLASSDGDIVESSLHTLATFLKKTTGKCCVRDATLISKLLSILQGWGSKEEGLGLIACSLQDGCDSVTSNIGSSLRFKFYKEADSQNEGSRTNPFTQGLQVIHMSNISSYKERDLEILNNLVDEYRVPCNLRFSLWTKLRFARAFGSLDSRKQFICIRLYAFIVLVHSHSDSLANFLNNEPDFVNELVSLMSYEELIPEKIRILGVLALITLCQEREHQSVVVASMTSSSHRGILSSLMQKTVNSISGSATKQSVNFCEALLSLVSVLVSSSPGSTALREAGILPTLLPLFKDTNPYHLHLVTTAVHVLERFMDYSNPAISVFRELGGLDDTIARLKVEVLAVDESPKNSGEDSFYHLMALPVVNSSRILDSPPANSVSQILYHRKLLIKALLRAISLGIYAPGTSSRISGAEESLLPQCLCLIFRRAKDFGGGVFSLAAAVMSDLLHKDPTCFPALEASSAPQAFLDVIVSGVICSSEAIGCIPLCLDAICLNNSGVQAVKESNALRCFVKIFTCRTYWRALYGDTPGSLSIGLEELLRHVSSLRSSGVEMLIEILNTVTNMGGGSDTSLSLESYCPSTSTNISIHDGHPSKTAETISDSSYDVSVVDLELFLPECVSNVCRLLETVLHNADTCRLFIEKKGVEAVLHLFNLPLMPFSASLGQNIAVAFKVFSPQHSGSLSWTVSSFMREQLKLINELLISVHGSKISDLETSMQTKFCRCFFTLDGLLSLLTFLLKGSTSIAPELSSSDGDLVKDLGEVYKEVLWQTSLCFVCKKDEKDSNKKPGATGADLSIITNREINDESSISPLARYRHPPATRNGNPSDWNFSQELFAALHSSDSLHRHSRHGAHRSRGGRASRLHDVDVECPISFAETSFVQDARKKSPVLLLSEIMPKLSLSIRAFHVSLVKGLMTRSRADQGSRVLIARNCATALAKLFHDALSYSGHSTTDLEASLSVKCIYLGKVVDDMIALIFDGRRRLCNTAVVNSFYTSGTFKELLTTFEATSQLLWTLHSTSFSGCAHGKTDENNLTHNSWLLDTLKSYCQLLGYFSNPSLLLSSSTSQAELLVQPTSTGLSIGLISIPRDPEVFVRMLQSQVMDAILPIWNHSLFPCCYPVFVTSLISIVANVYSVVRDAKRGSNNRVGSSSQRLLIPPINESSIASIVEMGFSRARAEEALTSVNSSSVEAAMDWLFSHPEEQVQEDVQFAQALALSLGNSSETCKDDNFEKMTDEPTEGKLMLPSVDDIISASMKLFQCNDYVIFPLTDLLTTLCYRDKGDNRQTVITFLVQHLKLCSSSFSKDIAGLSHVLALLFTEDPSNREIAAKEGVVSAVLDILTNLSLKNEPKEDNFVSKCMSALFLILNNMLQCKPKIPKDHVNGTTPGQDGLPLSMGKIIQSKEEDDECGEKLDNMFEIIFGPSTGHLTAEESQRTLTITCNLMKQNLGNLVMNGILRVCARITRNHALALQFLENGGLIALFNMPKDCMFPGFESMASAIIRHLLEDPLSLQAAMESEIKQNLMSSLSRRAGGLSPKSFLTTMAPVISRDPVIFMKASAATCQLESSGGRTCIVLRKEKEKEKVKPSGAEDSVHICDPLTKFPKTQKKVPAVLSTVINQLGEIIMSYPRSTTGENSGSSSALMDIDGSKARNKGKSKVCEIKSNYPSGGPFSFEKLTFSLKLMSDILLMYTHAASAILKRDSEINQFRASGMLNHIIHELLPLSSDGSSEEWKSKLSDKASTFLVTLSGRSTEGRRRVVNELVRAISEMLKNTGNFPMRKLLPNKMIMAFLSLIDSIASKCSSSSTFPSPISGCSPEVARTMIDAGMVQSLTALLHVIDLDHPSAANSVNYALKSLEILTRAENTTDQIFKTTDDLYRKKAHDRSEEITDISLDADVVTHTRNAGSQPENDSLPSVQLLAQTEHLDEDMEEDVRAQSEENAPSDAFAEHRAEFMHDEVDGRDALRGTDRVRLSFQVGHRTEDSMVNDDDEDMGDDGEDVDDDDDDDEDEDIVEDRAGLMTPEDRNENGVGDDHQHDDDDFGQDRVTEVSWRERLNHLDHLRILRGAAEVDGFFNVATEPFQGTVANDSFPFHRHLGIERRRYDSRNFHDLPGTDSNVSQHPLLSRPQAINSSVSAWDSANFDSSHLRMFDSGFPSETTENTFFGERLVFSNPSRLIDYSLGMDPFHVGGRRGLSNERWTDDGQPQTSRLSATIAQTVEEHFVSQLRRSVPSQTQPRDSNTKQEKSNVSLIDAKFDSSYPIESPICESDGNLASGEASVIENNQPVLETMSETEIPSIQMQGYPESQSSEFNTSGVGMASRNGSNLSSHAIIVSGSPIPDSSDGRVGSVSTSIGIDMNGIAATGNEAESSVPTSSNGAAPPSNESTGTHAIDPAFLEALPDDLRAEVLASQLTPPEWPAQPARPSEFLPPVSGEIDPEFLAALPPDIQTEVLAQQRAQRLVLSQQATGLPVDMDNASIIATFPPELRQEVLLTSSEAVLSSLPSNFLAEAQMLRDRAASHYHAHSSYFTGNRRFGSRRLAVDRGVGVTAGQRMLPMVTNKPTDELQGVPLLDMDDLKALIRLLRLSQLGKGLLQRLMLNLCSHSFTRTNLIRLLLETIEPSVDGVANSSTPSDSHRPFGFELNVWSDQPHSIEDLSPIVSRRVLEILTYLATNHSSVSSLLIFFEIPRDAEPLSKFEYNECYKRKAPESLAHDSCLRRFIPLILFLKLLNVPLYLRSDAHLEQVMSLLQVVVNNVVVKIESQPSSKEVAVCEAKKDIGSSHNTKNDSSVSDDISNPGCKITAICEILAQLPESDLKNLSGLLSREGLSEKVYSLASEVVKKLAAVAEPHFKFFIAELASLAHGLSGSAVNELATLKRDGMLGLSASCTAGAGFLRVLQTLSSLNHSHDGNKAQETDFENGEESAVWKLHESLHPLWQELSDCMSIVELKLGHNVSSAQRLNDGDSGGLSSVSPPLPPGTQRLLPFIEAFFILSEKLHNRNNIIQTESNCRGTAETPGSSSLSPLRCAGRAITFARVGEKHRRLLNAFIRQNPGLLEKSLSMMLKVPRLIDFDNKRAYFRSKIRQQHDQHLAPIRVSVRRAYVLEDSYNQLRMRSSQELKGRLAIHFQGEEGIDAGGLTREWYQILSRVIFDKGALLFTTVGNSLTFQPNPNSVYQTEHLSYFKFVGRLVAKAVFDSQLLDVYFTRSFYKHILGVKVTYHDIEAIDPDYYKNLKWMLENDVSEIPDLTFSMDPDEEKHILYEKTEVMDYELKPGGRNIRVTEETKHEYVDLVADHILSTAIRPQINSFLEGFHELIPRELISIFNDKELELLISGLPEIDMDDLESNTEYTGYSAASSIIQWFWEVVKSFSKEDMARFLQFVTGTSKVPLEGFKALQGLSGPQRFQIHKAYGAPERLPSAHTCFNQLDLPEYSSKDQLEERLLLGIHESSEGFGFG